MKTECSTAELEAVVATLRAEIEALRARIQELERPNRGLGKIDMIGYQPK